MGVELNWTPGELCRTILKEGHGANDRRAHDSEEAHDAR